MPDEPKSAPTKAAFNWTPLPVEQMPRHPIAQADITLKDQPVVATAPAAAKPKPVVAPAVVVAPRPVPVIDRVQTNGHNTYNNNNAQPTRPRLQSTIRQVQMDPHQQQRNNHTNNNSYHNRTQSVLHYPPSFLEKVRNTPAISPQSRLHVRPAGGTVSPSEGPSLDSGLSASPKAHPVAPITFVEKLDQSPLVLLPAAGDAIAQLSAFCAQHKIAASPPRVLTSKFVVVCQVTVDGRTFSATAEKEQEARTVVAERALAHLKLALQRKQYPVVQEDNHVLAVRLHELLLHYPRGVMEKNLPELFQQTTGTSLPDHWTSLVTTYSRFFCVDSGPLAHVVYANELSADEDGDDANEDEESDDNSHPAVDESVMQLPWSEEHWNLHVTHVVNTAMVWARIIGVDFCENWDQLMTDIEVAMADPANCRPVEGAQVDCVYLVEREAEGEKFWYRVRGLELDTEGSRLLAFFVDLGSEEWLPLDSLCVCEDRFQVLPGQAVPFTLSGLESMEENPHAKPILDEVLQGHSIVAEIKTRAEDYVEGARLKAVFYDTSSEEDVNLVELLHDKICSAGTAPQLKPTGLTQVVVTHVSDRGQVFCQVPGSGMEYVQKVVDRLAQSADLLDQFRGLRKDTAGGGDCVTRYLVYDRANDKWARAVLKVRHPLTADTLMYCLDTGCQVKVAEADVYQLDALSMALSRYPAMAVRCALYDVPKMDPHVVSRAKALLEPQSIALVKVVSVAGIDKTPQVNFYQRLEANNVIVCINDTLRLESDFESSFAAV